MKKIIFYFLVCAILAVNYSCSSDNFINAESIKLNESSVEIKKGQQKQLSVIVLPENCEESLPFLWTVEDYSIATVSQAGMVTAIKGGKTKVTVKVEDRFSASCDINVVSDITSIILNRSEISLKKGDVFTLEATISPEDATDKTIEWSSDNQNVVTVSSEGVLNTVGNGTATITAKNPSSGISDKCNVTVYGHVESVSLNKSAIEIFEGEVYTLTETVLPNDAIDKNVKWTSSDESIATVENGVVKGIKKGTATITVTTNDKNKTATCEVTIKPSEDINYTPYDDPKQW